MIKNITKFKIYVTPVMLLFVSLFYVTGCIFNNGGPNLVNTRNDVFSKHEVYKTIIVEKLVSVYDGDTFRCDLKGKMPDLFKKSILIRINGIDTPEIKGDAINHDIAVEAQEFTYKMLSNGRVIELRNPQRDKYFRILADVYVDGIKVADKLLENELAKEYHGESKEGIW